MQSRRYLYLSRTRFYMLCFAAHNKESRRHKDDDDRRRDREERDKRSHQPPRGEEKERPQPNGVVDVPNHHDVSEPTIDDYAADFEVFWLLALPG